MILRMARRLVPGDYIKTGEPDFWIWSVKNVSQEGDSVILQLAAPNGMDHGFVLYHDDLVQLFLLPLD